MLQKVKKFIKYKDIYLFKNEILEDYISLENLILVKEKTFFIVNKKKLLVIRKKEIVKRRKRNILSKDETADKT